MDQDLPLISARTTGLAVGAGALLALGALAATHSPDLLAQAAWVYTVSLLLLSAPPTGRRAVFAVLLTGLIALAACIQDALGHEISGPATLAQMVGVWPAYAVMKLASAGGRRLQFDADPAWCPQPAAA